MASGSQRSGFWGLVGIAVVAAGIFFGYPIVKKWFAKPHLERTTTPPTDDHEGRTTPPTLSMSEILRDPFAGKTSAQRRDAMIESIKTSVFYRPSISAMTMLDPDDFSAVQAALTARDSAKKPWLTDVKGIDQLLFPKDRLITPKLSDDITTRLLQIGSSPTSQPAIAAGKVYSQEELVAALQPAVPMVRVRQVVEVTYTVSGGKQQTGEVSFGGTGSGFVIDAAGHVVTNWHVAANVPTAAKVVATIAAASKVQPADVKLVGNPEARAPEIKLVFQGRHRAFAKSLPIVGPAEAQRSFTLSAKLIGADEEADLAVLKIDGCTFPYLTFADSTGVKAGAQCVAVGYPFGDRLEGDASASPGAVSGVGRSLDNGLHADQVQYTALTNPGNSGGPVLNSAGRVIAVHTYGGFKNQGGEGMNFGRSPRTAATFVDQIIRLGRVVRPDVGFAVARADFRDDQTSRDANLAYGSVPVVANVRRRSNVDLFDLILQVNGRSVTTEGEWFDALGLLEKDRPATVRLTVKRAPVTLRAEAVKKQVDWDVVLRAAWEAPEMEVTVPLTWPK